jgi:hypothetical protein
MSFILKYIMETFLQNEAEKIVIRTAVISEPSQRSYRIPIREVAGGEPIYIRRYVHMRQAETNPVSR